MVPTSPVIMAAWDWKKNSLSVYSAIALLGVMQAVALAEPRLGESTAWLQLVSLTGFIWLLHSTASHPSTFKLAWVFATSWLMASVWWLYISIHHFGGMPAALTVMVIGLLCGGLALYYALTIRFYMSYRSKKNPWFSAVLFASCWTLGELARAEFFTGFPWGAIGYAHVDSVLVEFAPYVGVYGVGWIAAFTATVMAYAVASVKTQNIRLRVISAAALLVGLALFTLPWTLSGKGSTHSFSVSLLQGNIPQDLKFTELRQQALTWYVDQALQSTTDVVVMPETALPYLPKDIPPETWAALKNQYSKKQQALIVGIPTYEEGKGFGNSAIAMAGNSEEYVYHKQHLVPFGEFVPSYFQWFNAMVNFGITDFIRGPIKPDPLKWRDQQLAIQICYEDLFGEELAQRFVTDKESIPTVLVNMSNIAWFGNTVVIPQHVHIARMRSMELNRPTIRATNSGGTAIIDSSGKVQAIAQPYTQTVLVGQVPASDGRVTWFAQWAGRWGLIPLWIICCTVLLLSAGIQWRNKRREHSH